MFLCVDSAPPWQAQRHFEQPIREPAAAPAIPVVRLVAAAVEPPAVSVEVTWLEGSIRRETRCLEALGKSEEEAADPAFAACRRSFCGPFFLSEELNLREEKLNELNITPTDNKHSFDLANPVCRIEPLRPFKNHMSRGLIVGIESDGAHHTAAILQMQYGILASESGCFPKRSFPNRRP
ncbi:MAG: hypothetical protein KF777_11155 [Planctomycetaceae bacterium]|nr:hypothetical protein [Planctomycetaceae bacterium]